MPKTNPLVRSIFILLLTALVIHQYATDRFNKEAVDFYNFWAVPTAQRLSGHTLGSPYPAVARYGEFLKRYVAQVPDDVRLFRSTVFWYGNPEERLVRRNNTPLLYTAFGILPESYSTAAAVFRWTGMGLFVTTVLMLGYLYGVRPFHSAVVGLTLLLIFFPAHRDLSFGNVNVFLLFALTVLLTLYRFLDRVSASGRPVFSALLATGIVMVVMLKPVMFLPCLLLALLFGFHATIQDRIAATSAGLVAFLAGMAGPSWFFRSWAVWQDWVQTVTEGRALLYPSRGANSSLVMLLAERVQAKSIFVTIGIGSVLVMSLLLAIRRRCGHFVLNRAYLAAWLEQAGRVFTDPGLVVSIGVIFTLAVSPLVWIHYYVLAIIPASWVCAHPTRSRVGMLMAAIFAVFSSEVLFDAMREIHMAHWYLSAQALSWIPLWTGILIAIRTRQPPTIPVDEEIS